MSSKLQAWFASRVAESIRWNTACAALLIPSGMLATFLTYWAVWILIRLGLGSLFDLSSAATHGLTTTFVVVSFVWQFTVGRHFEETYAITRDKSEQQKISLTREVRRWDPEIAAMLIRALTLTFLMGPRMLGASVQLWYRARRLKQMNIRVCGQIVAFLMKAQGRVEIDDIAQRFPDNDVVRLLQPLADFDGIVFLQKDSLALTLAPRLVEDFEEWSGGE